MAKHTTERLQVKARVTAAGWTAREIADRLGLSRSYVSHVIAGRRGSRPSESPDVQANIARLLEYDPDALFGPLCHPELRGLTWRGTQRTQRSA